MIEKEIIPLLRKQQGFQDEVMFIASAGMEAVGLESQIVSGKLISPNTEGART